MIPSLMCIEDGLCKAARLKERKAQQHRVAHTSPDGVHNISTCGDVFDQHRIDTHADDDEKRLKRKRQQGTEIVLAHVAPFTVDHGSHGDGCNGCDKVDLNHASVDHHEDADGKSAHGQPYEQALEPQPEQRSQFHGSKSGIQVPENRRDIYVCI